MKLKREGGMLPERIRPAAIDALSREEFYRRYPASEVVREPTLNRWRGPVWALAGAGSALAAATVLIAVLLSPETTEVPTSLPSPAGSSSPAFGTGGAVRYKGNDRTVEVPPSPSTARAVLISESGSVQVKDGAILHAGDVLKFHYDTARHDYLFLVGVDEQGNVSTWYPEKAGASVPIARGINIPLPEAVQLDDYVGKERVFALFTGVPLSHVEVEGAVKSAMTLAAASGGGLEDVKRLPLQAEQWTLVYEKR